MNSKTRSIYINLVAAFSFLTTSSSTFAHKSQNNAADVVAQAIAESVSHATKKRAVQPFTVDDALALPEGELTSLLDISRLRPSPKREIASITFSHMSNDGKTLFHSTTSFTPMPGNISYWHHTSESRGESGELNEAGIDAFGIADAYYWNANIEALVNTKPKHAHQVTLESGTPYSLTTPFTIRVAGNDDEPDGTRIACTPKKTFSASTLHPVLTGDAEEFSCTGQPDNISLTMIYLADNTRYYMSESRDGDERSIWHIDSVEYDPVSVVNASIIVKIGHVAPLTGNIAFLGRDNENGARLAIEDANTKGIKIGGKAIRFELDAMDDGPNPTQAMAVAHRLVEDKVVGVVGHLNSGTSIPASSIYAAAGIPQITPSATNPTLTEQGFATTFRVIANDRAQARILASFVVNTLKLKRVAVIDDGKQYGQNIAEGFIVSASEQNKDIAIVRSSISHDETDYQAQLREIAAAKPDAIIFGGMDEQASLLVKQMHAMGMRIPLISGDGVETRDFIIQAGADAENQYATQPGDDLQRIPAYVAFAARYKARFGIDVQWYAPYTYDATMVLIEAMRAAESVEPAIYLPFLHKTDYRGIVDRIRFDKAGDLIEAPIGLYVVHQGKWEYVRTMFDEPGQANDKRADKNLPSQ